MIRIVETPRSTRICEPIPYSRRVGGEAELDVGLDGVAALVLERVGADLVAEADAAALVAAQVHDDARALASAMSSMRGVELQAAVAAHRPEHVAGEALGVHAHEHVVLARDLAPHEGDVLGAVEQRLEHVAGEVAVLGRDARLGDPAHQLLAVAPVADEVGDRDQLQAVLRGEALELGRRAMVPSSLTTSASTPAGCSPARRARSTAASVWPARLSTPPSR